MVACTRISWSFLRIRKLVVARGPLGPGLSRFFANEQSMPALRQLPIPTVNTRRSVAIGDYGDSRVARQLSRAAYLPQGANITGIGVNSMKTEGGWGWV